MVGRLAEACLRWGRLAVAVAKPCCLRVQAKEEEKATLLKMCDELMNQLEREGLALDGPGA